MASLRHQIRDQVRRLRESSPAERLADTVCVLAAAGLLVWAARLWPEWRRNPDLSHGFLALPIVVMLWIRAREEAARARGLGGGAQLALGLALGAGLLGATLLATVYAVALGWSAGPTLFLLGAAAAGGAGLAATLAAGRGVGWISPGWAALIIPVVILLSGPLPPGSYARLTLGLQEAITVGVVETLRLVGIPAMRAGNVIHLGQTSVGVEEACSGVRSLISCVLAGLVLSALMLRTPGRRAVLVLAAAPLALLTNFARSLTLTLLARNGLDISGAWHDGLGFAVLGVTTALLAWIAVALEGRELETSPRGGPVTGGKSLPASARSEALAVAEPGSGPAPTGLGLAALASMALALGWLGYVAARSEGDSAAPGPVPDLARIVPAENLSPSWRVTTRDDLDRFAGILQTTHLLERIYLRRDADGREVQLTVYAAWWPAGATSVSSVAAHTPEACWPGAGWEMVAAEGGRRELALPGGGTVREAEQRVFQREGYPQTVWFWHLVGGEPFRPFEPRSWREQLAVFVEHGVRRDPPQAFVRISSNRAWAEIAGDPLIEQVLAGFAELGVPVARPAK